MGGKSQNAEKTLEETEVAFAGLKERLKKEEEVYKEKK